MILGVDASNIRGGGGVTHLSELLRAAKPSAFGFDRVVVWASQATLARVEERSWLLKRSAPELNGLYLSRLLWQLIRLSALAKDEGCGLLFVPGGTFVTKFRPVVTMSQNLLPFDRRELLRFGVSPTTVRLMALRLAQARSFKKAQGTIFLTHYARSVVLGALGLRLGRTAIVAHGIDQRFFMQPHPQRSIGDYSKGLPFRLLYVSIVNTYKHQWHVAEAVAKLRTEGFPVTLDLIGPAYPSALQRLRRTLRRVDPKGAFIRYCGERPYLELHSDYASADVNVFASSCENLPNILLEGMAAGLPTVCSDRGPMPEVLGDAGFYFDPEDPDDIARALRKLINSPDLRARLAKSSFERAQAFSWQRCASETFGFLAEVAGTHSTSSSATGRA